MDRSGFLAVVLLLGGFVDTALMVDASTESFLPLANATAQHQTEAPAPAPTPSKSTSSSGRAEQQDSGEEDSGEEDSGDHGNTQLGKEV